MNALERFGIAAFAKLARHGTLDVELPGGEVAQVGAGEPHASVAIADYDALRRIAGVGLTGFAEAYMDAEIDTPDLPQLLAWGVANQTAWFQHPLARVTLPIRKLTQKIRPEKRHARVRSMNDHYNLGNDFYAAWLDDSMTYSSARFATTDQDLNGAQLNKYRTIADHAGLRPGMKILEIGCGWGGFARFAATERQCEVVGITLSAEQAAYASKLMAENGLTDKVEIRIQDFRQVNETYDAIVSIEMIESVDESHWPPLFDTIEGSLRPGAQAAMQIITIRDDEWDKYRSRADFIQQYIFPGGQIPAPKILKSMAARSGLDVRQIETFGLDYARTLAIWRDNFKGRWDSLQVDHGLDDRFHRMWDLYLTLCEAGFRMGRINVEQWTFSRRHGSNYAEAAATHDSV